MNPEKNFRKKLDRNADFSPKENMVIEALISLKMARTTSKIAREAKLPRTTTAFILRKLEKRRMAIGIAKKTKMGQRYVWKIKTMPSTD